MGCRRPLAMRCSIASRPKPSASNCRRATTPCCSRASSHTDEWKVVPMDLQSSIPSESPLVLRRSRSERVDLRGAQTARLAHRQHAHPQRPQRDALKRPHRMPHRLAHPPYLALAALVQDELQAVGSHHPHRRRRRHAVGERHPRAQRPQRLLPDRPAAHPGHVRPRHLVARVHEPVRQLAVVGEQDEAGGVGVQPADWIQARARRRDQPHHRRSTLRVARRRHHAGGLVDHPDDALLRAADELAVDAHLRRHGDPAPEVGHHLPVDGHPPGPDQVLGRPAGGHTRVGEVLGEPHGSATIGRAMDLELLERTLTDRGEPTHRATQVWAWAARGACSYEAMTDLPAALRTALAREVPLSSLQLEQEAQARDGTRKALFTTEDGKPVEAVLMRYRDGRNSLCLSSQSGCPLTCTFCATGSMKFGRNLTSSEILDQALHFRRTEPVNHAVFMGMGEPLMNLDAVLGACERLPDVGIAHSNTGVSTVGWIPGIDQMASEGPPVRLALSVHAADEALRSELMPVNDRYPLREVLDACLRWHARRRRQVFIEYLILDGVNDRYEQASRLAELLEPRNAFKVNLIPYNPTDAPYRGSGRQAVAAFRAALEERGLRTTVRVTRGRDIDAACGQLAAMDRAHGVK